MSDPSLAERLRAADATPTVTAFPDGSRDTFYHVHARDGERLADREAFAERVAADHPTPFDLERVAVEPGGHAVNLAQQARALGGDVQLFGHLDDPVFDDLAVEAVSMGSPARVAIHEFEDGDLLFVEASPDVASWDLDALRDAADGDLEPAMTADAVCCVNWAAFDGMTAALRRIADRSFDGAWFLVDPGDFRTRDRERVAAFAAAVAALQGSYDVVLATNPAEMSYLADALDVATADDPPVEAVRDRLDLAGVVTHGVNAAVGATGSGELSVPNYRVERKRRATGGGDRFDAGLAHALAAGWGWRAGLELGNRCASFYVERAATGTPAELASFERPRR